ncbi:rhoptry kinase family protein rop32 [Cystoisospora suis]|uniref:Rhoptry kinase family protein rop32 n=1 Tax=Cystoisospora suis TaxID=483139 RepID=A0A2C6L5X3_9APIC|nr:rhoptry kinase family protein rop32 [Cystoisospora suis]
MDTPSTDATRSEEISDERAKSSSDLLQLYPYNSDHRLGYVNRGVPSDPEAVKDIAEMVASMNTDALVVKSKKRHLASAFNQYLPPGQEFTLQAPADAEYPPPPVVFVRGPILGIGGNGLVYEAQTSDGRVYALKSLLVRMKSFSKKAKKEANTGGPAWRHEEDRAFSRVLQKEMHVLKFFPPGKTAEQLYGQGFVLPLFQGILQGKPKVTILSEDYAVTNVVVGFPRVACSVGQLVGAYRLSDAVKLELTRQMIALVARLHSYGILHADVKWENFFLDSTGRVFLGDFEQSQVLREGKTAPCGPRAGGTPSLHEPARAACYFSDPERPLDLMASRDSWCLGMITYKLWCRAFPYHLKFDPNKVPEYMHRLATIEREGTTVDFDRCPESPELPEELQTLISGLLYHDRYLRVLPLSLIYTSSIFEPYLENTDTHASTHHSEMEAR